MSADSWTDEELIKIENHLRVEFKAAQKEIKAKSEAYFEKFFKMDKIKAKQVEDGTLSQEEYNQWRHNKIMYGEHWHNLVDQVTKELLNVNKTALDYINGKVPQIYAVNFNSIAEVIENSPVEGYSFELVNADTVKNLEGQEDIMLPPPKDIDAIKDIAWNAKKVNSVVMQGILQGSSMKEIADKLAVAVCESNEKAAIRNARTMVTAAENSGRQSGMNRAEASGIIFKKRWIATNDSRTRPSHMAQHGELVNNGEKFSNGLMFPGDWHGKPAEIYNCRCTLGSWVTGFKKLNGKDAGKVVPVTPKSSPPKLTEKIIEAAIKSQVPEKITLSSSIKSKLNKQIKPYMSDSDYKEFLEMLESNPNEIMLFNKYAGKVKWVYDEEGFFSPVRKELHWHTSSHPDKGKFETIFHEFGHAVDRLLSTNGDELSAVEAKKIGNSYPNPFKSKIATSSTDKFLTAMREDKKNMLDYIELHADDRGVLKNITMKSPELHTGGIQDFISGIAGYDTKARSQIKWQHSEDYYNRLYDNHFDGFGNRQSKLKKAYGSLGLECNSIKDMRHLTRDYETSSELWANINAAYAEGGEVYENMKKWCPSSCATFEELIGGIK